MKRTIEHYGASFLITLSVPVASHADRGAAAQTLAQEVNGLYNNGMISTPPEDYDDKADNSVIVTTNRKRLLKGCETKALALLEEDDDLRTFLKGHDGYVMANAAKELAPKLAVDFLRGFERVQSEYRRNRVETLAPHNIGDTHEGIGWNNETVS